MTDAFGFHDPGDRIAAIERFFTTLHGQSCDEYTVQLTWVAPATGWSSKRFHSSELTTLATRAVELSESGSQVFARAFGADPEATVNLGKRGGAEVSTTMVAVFADLDLHDPREPRKASYPTSSSEVQELLPLTPTMVVHTGHGLHGYWVLTSSVDLTTLDGREQGSRLLKGFQLNLSRILAEAGYGTDANSFDLARVMRVPYTWNLKYPDDPQPAHVIAHSRVSYSLDDLAPYIDEVSSVRSTEVHGVVPHMLDAEVPPDRLQRLYERSAKFRSTWDAERTDLQSDASRYDLSLASFAARDGWTRPQQAALIREWRRRHRRDPEKAGRLDYIERTLALANDGVPVCGPDDEPRTRPDECDHSATAVPGVLEGPTGVQAGFPEEDQHALADGFRGTDVGNAARLAATLAGSARYVRAWRTWIVYLAGAWRIDVADALITEFAKTVPREMFRLAATLHGGDREPLWRWARQSERASAIAAMVKLARGIDGIIIEHTALDTHPWLFNVRNGTIDLRTGTLLAPDPAHLLTAQAPVAYDPLATCPTWDACLERWQPDSEARAYLQKIVGSGATGHPVEHLFVNTGGGANGKGKFIGAVAAVLGSDYFVVVHKGLVIAARHDQHDTVKARLRGARLAVCAETDEGDRLDEAKVKELTGGDLIEARRMHEDPWPFEPSHTLLAHTNNRPAIRGNDEGIWRRVRLVPWSVTIPVSDRDPRLAAKLAVESSGILNWIVTGAREWFEAELDFGEPKGVVDATQAYREDEDHVGQFLEDRCAVGPTYTITAANLRSTYERWCADAGEQPMSAKALGARLTALGFRSKHIGGRQNRARTWCGFGLGADRHGEVNA